MQVTPRSATCSVPAVGLGVTSAAEAAAAAEVAKDWSAAEIEQLSWDRFDVTDSDALKIVNTAFEAGDYDLTQRLIDAWRDDDTETFDSLAKQAKPLAKDDGVDPSPYAGKKKRRRQGAVAKSRIMTTCTRTGRDISISDDDEAPIDR